MVDNNNGINFRQGATQVQRAIFNAGTVQLIGLETILASWYVGDHAADGNKWSVGIIAFVFFMCGWGIPFLRVVLAAAVCMLCAYWSYILSRGLSGGGPVDIVVSVFVGMLWINAHRCFFQWQKDFRSAN